MRHSTISTVVALIAVFAFAGSALAAKPSSSLTLVVLSDAVGALSVSGPVHGGEITFDVSTTQTDRPFVNLRCYQDGVWVYDGWHGFFESYVPDPVYTLASTYWTEGAADCAARLLSWGKNGNWKTLATTSFHVTD